MLLPGRRGPELADILKDHVHDLGPLSHDKSRVVRDILDCRTPILGGHLYKCDDCERKVSHWNSCLNRHCPGCGGMEQAAWVTARFRDVLPGGYIHIIVTVSDCMHPRGKFLAFVRKAQESRRIGLAQDRARTLMRVAWTKTWNVSLRKPISDPMNVVKYLARYTRKTAFSNSRLVSYKNNQVRFSYKDHKTGKREVMSLPAVAFLNRFLQHVSPRRFVRIRYYGLLDHPVKGKLIPRARELLGVDQTTTSQDDLSKTWRVLYPAITSDDFHTCPYCQRGRLIAVAVVPSTRANRHCVSTHAP